MGKGPIIVKSNNQEIWESERKFRTLVEGTNACLFTTDKRGRFTYLNEGAFQALGYQKEELLGKFYLKFVHKYDKRSIHELFNAQLQTGVEAVNTEFRFVRKDGSTGWFMFLVNPVFSDDIITGLTGVALDITDRKRAESELRDEKSFTEKALNAQMDTFLVFEPVTGKTVRWNSAFRETSGYTDEEISSMKYPDPWFDESDILKTKEIDEDLRNGQQVTLELSFITRDGSIIPTEYSISPIMSKQGELKHIIYVGRDITERKIAEQRLMQSESHYRELFENMSDGVAVYNVSENGNKFTFANMNKAGQRISVVNIDDIRGKDVLQVFPKVEQIGLLDTFKRVWRTGEPEFLPVTYYEDDRICEWVENYVYKLPTGEIIAIYNDVSERKKAEEALRESERKYREVVENASEIIMTTEINGNYRLVNQAGLNSSGYTLDELRKKNYLDLIPEEYKKRVQLHYMRQYLKNQHFSHLEYPYLTKLGEIRWLSQSASLIIENNEPVGFHLVARDVTERRLFESALRESEERFRLSFEDASIGMCIVDLEGYILRANQQMSNIFGYTKAEFAEMHVNDIAYQEDKNLSSDFIKKASNGGLEQTGFEKRYYHKDGHTVYGYVSSSLIKSTEGRPLYFISHVQDITLRRKAEIEIEDSRRRLRELTAHIQEAREAERTMIARELHDELGQAMTALNMDTIWLKKNIPMVSDNITDKIDSMKSVIDSAITTMKRLSAELRPAILDDLGLKAAIEWQAEEFLSRASIKYRIDETIENVSISPERSVAIFRIFQECLNNIVKHANATEVRISLILENGNLILTVKDNGIGITKDNVNSCETYGIIGMKERAAYLNGYVSIEGESNIGTTVMITIPLHGVEKH